MMSAIHYCALSFVFFLIFGYRLSDLISQVFPVYKTLAKSPKHEWNTRNLSSFHALIVSTLCIYAIIMEDQLKKHLVHGSSRIAEANVAIAAGYLSADLLPLLYDYRNIKHNIGYIIHHAVSVYAYILALSTGFLLFFANFRLIAEVSTPFVNLRWALAVSNNKNGRLYFYNGCIMTLLFFLSRIVVLPYYYYMVLYVVNTSQYIKSVSTLVHVSWIGVCVVLDILNFVWFYKMINGIKKHILKTNSLLQAVENKQN